MTFLPKNWVITDLKSIVEILDHKRIPINSKERQKRKENKKINELYPYYGATGQVDYIDDYLFDGEYILLGEDGAPFLNPLKNKAYFVSGKFWVNNHAHILRGYISNKYLCFYLNQYNFIEHVTGTTRLKLNQSSMKNITIKVAPFNEQNRIVEKIEELFSDLDKATDDLIKTQEQLKIYRQAVLKAAFEGKLTEEWREQNNIELSFKEISLIDVADIILGQSPPSSTYNTNRVGLPFYQGKKEFGDLYPTPEKYCSEPKKIAEPDDILISVRAPVGSTNFCRDKSCIGRGLVAIRVKERIKNYYLFYYLRYFVFNLIEKSTGTTFNAISKNVLEGFKVLLFSLQEQQQIINEIESRLSVCDKLEETIQQSLEKIDYLRQSILKKAFEGKLVQQDSNDETAEKLLERIKLEKEKIELNNKKRKTR